MENLSGKTHRLIGSDRIQVGSVVIVANLRKHVREVTAVDHKLGIHESLKVEQVSYDVDGWENIQDIISKAYKISSLKNIREKQYKAVTVVIQKVCALFIPKCYILVSLSYILVPFF